MEQSTTTKRKEYRYIIKGREAAEEQKETLSKTSVWDIKSFRIRIIGWRIERSVCIKDGHIYFQIASERHCEACDRRMHHITSLLLEAKGEAKYGYLTDPFHFVKHFEDVPVLWIGLPVHQGVCMSDVLALLEDKLHLSIDYVSII